MNPSWLSVHTTEFIEKRIGYNPSLVVSIDIQIPSEKMTIIKNIWRSAKRIAENQNQKILLLGRDTWVFEVLARRENYSNSIFDPTVSRLTCNHYSFKEKYSSKRYVLLDTGFMGSIARTIGIDFMLLSANRMSPEVKKTQIFPNLKGARSLALYLESLPKYWKTARLDENSNIVQEFSDLIDFALAFKLTKQVYKDSSKRFITRAECENKRRIYA